jgi:hypothetical protein
MENDLGDVRALEPEPDGGVRVSCDEPIVEVGVDRRVDRSTVRGWPMGHAYDAKGSVRWLRDRIEREFFVQDRRRRGIVHDHSGRPAEDFVETAQRLRALDVVG